MGRRCLEWFLMGLCGGMGFHVSLRVLNFIVGLLGGGH